MEELIIILKDIKDISDGRLDNLMIARLNKLFFEVSRLPIKTIFEEGKELSRSIVDVFNEFSSDITLFRCLNIFNVFLQDTKYFYCLLEFCKTKNFKKSMKFISNNSTIDFLQLSGYSENTNLQIEFLYEKFKNKTKIISKINSYDVTYKLNKLNGNFKNYKILNEIFSENYDKDLFSNLCKNENIKLYISGFKTFHESGLNFINFINNHDNIDEKYYLIDFIIKNSHNEKFLNVEVYKLRYQYLIYDIYTNKIKELLYCFKYNEIRKIILNDIVKFKDIISIDFLKYHLLESITDKNGILFIKFLLTNTLFSFQDVEFIYKNINNDLKVHLENLIKNNDCTSEPSKLTQNYLKYYVYRFIDYENRILYIGKTHNMWERMSSHKSNSNVDRDCILSTNKIEFIETYSDSESSMYEIYYISKLKPIYNKEYNISTHISFDIPDKIWKTYNFSMSSKVKNNKVKSEVNHD